MKPHAGLAAALVLALMATALPTAAGASTTAMGMPRDSHRGRPVALSKTQGPYFNGTWVNQLGTAGFDITSGTSTTIAGIINYGPSCPNSHGTVSGTIVNGVGTLMFHQDTTNGCIVGLFGPITISNVKAVDGIAETMDWVPPGAPAGTPPGTYTNISIAIDVSLTSNVPSAGLAIGSTANVTGTVTAINGTIKNIKFGPGLISTSSAVTIGTPPSGLSGFSLTSGESRSFVFSVKGAQSGSTTLGLVATGQTSQGTLQATGKLNLVVGAKSLQVNVTATPDTVELTDVPDSVSAPGGAPVTVTVTVKNNGPAAVSDLYVINKLLISYNDGDPVVPVVPLRQNGAPDPTGNLGTLAKGATSKPVTFKLLAKGDGGYSIQALATAQPPSGSVIHGSGTASVKIHSPLLRFETALGPEVDQAPGWLLAAGLPYTIDVTLQDLSYRKELAVATKFSFAGNAQGGELIPAEDPIPQQDGADLETACGPTGLVTLMPRETKEFKLVVYTESAWVRSEGKTGGGTRSVVNVINPVAGIPNKAGDDIETFLSPADIDMSGDTRYEVSLQDPGFDEQLPATFWDFGGVTQFAKGFLIGASAFSYGLAHGLLVDLPTLVGEGIQAIPTAVLNIISFESELFESLKDDPAKLALAVLDPVYNLILAEEAAAPAFHEALKKIAAQVNATTYSYLKTMSEDWFAGNWKGAVQEFATSGTELSLNAATLIPSVASCVLVRSKTALTALSEAAAAKYAAAAEKIGPLTELVSASAAISKIADLVPGMQLGYEQLLKLYGLTREQVDYLRDFAQRNKVLITVRGRASASVDWLAGKVVDGVKYAGAVLKPEQIKIKTVSWLDTQVLGYRPSDLGRVVLRKPITAAELQANLRAKGIASTIIDAQTGESVDNPVWQDAFKLLKQRVNEYTHERGGFTSGSGGYYRDLTDAAKEGKITLRWNLADNAVDPAIAQNGYTTYPFRLFDEGGGNLVPEFFTGGEWRCVTGDVDFLSMGAADATPLPAAARFKLYSALAGDNPVHMLHPAADTWSTPGSFWFPAKQNEFARAGIVPEFSPDGIVRAVLYDPKLSYWISPEVYRPVFTGSYVPPPTF